MYLAPDRPAHATSRSAATNYQGKVEWAPYATRFGEGFGTLYTAE